MGEGKEAENPNTINVTRELAERSREMPHFNGNTTRLEIFVSSATVEEHPPQ